MIQIKNYEKLQTKEGNTKFVLHLFSVSPVSYEEAKKFCKEKAKQLDISEKDVEFRLSWDKSFADVAPYDEERNRLWQTLVDFLKDKRPGVAGVITNPEVSRKITADGITVSVPGGMYDIVARTGVCECIEGFLADLYKNDSFGFGPGGDARFYVNEKGAGQ